MKREEKVEFTLARISIWSVVATPLIALGLWAAGRSAYAKHVLVSGIMLSVTSAAGSYWSFVNSFR